MKQTVLLFGLTIASPIALADLGTGFDREPISADPQKYFDNCVYAPELRERVDACTYVIKAGIFGPRDLSIAYNNRGIAQGKLRQHDAALADFEISLNLDPAYADALHNRAVEFARFGQLREALEDLSAAINLKPHADFYRSRGVVHENLGFFAQAIDDYSQAAKMDPDDFASRNSMAWILATAPKADLRKGKRAVQAAQEALNLQDSPSHRDTLAAAYAEAGDFSSAVEIQKEAIGMLRDLGAKDAVQDFERRLSLYQQGQPYRQD